MMYSFLHSFKRSLTNLSLDINLHLYVLYNILLQLIYLLFPFHYMHFNVRIYVKFLDSTYSKKHTTGISQFHVTIDQRVYFYLKSP